jgi:acyl carrier protein
VSNCLSKCKDRPALKPAPDLPLEQQSVAEVLWQARDGEPPQPDLPGICFAEILQTAPIRSPYHLKGSEMERTEARVRLLELLSEVAPDADINSIRSEISFRDQFVFDSVDFLNFALKVQEAFGFPIPESDFPELATLAGCLAYLQRVGAL